MIILWHAHIDQSIKRANFDFNFISPDYPSYYASADAFVLSTHGEGWGRTPMEAMAMGLPTIASKWSGLTEFISAEYAIPINISEVEPAFPHEQEKLGEIILQLYVV